MHPLRAVRCQAADLPQMLSDGSTLYVPGVGQWDGTSWAYELTDGLGSVRQLSDARGNIIQRYEYSPFGEVVAAEGQRSSALQYTGEQKDIDTGLIYLRARWYDPATGRFTSRDPFPGFAALPQTLHPYVYTNNNPINLADPSGEIPIETVWDLVIFGVDVLLAIFDTLNPALDECTRAQVLSLDRLAIGLDLAALLAPYIPGGGGLAARLAGRGVLVLAQVGVRVSSGARIIQVGVKGAQTVTHLAQVGGRGGGTRGSMGSGGNYGGSRRGDLKIYEDGYLKRMGIDAHKFKEGIVGKSNISKYNIAIGKDESVWLVRADRAWLTLFRQCIPDMNFAGTASASLTPVAVIKDFRPLQRL